MMHPKRRERCRSIPPDLLSNLPDNVIDVILMCLPCKAAVRTSILSKKWRYHWCRLTKLTLDGSLFKTKKDLRYPTAKFNKVIYQLLTLHKGPITKLTLSLGCVKTCPNIDNFVYFLSRNGIQHLSLSFPYSSNKLLPSSLFTCLQLRHLYLYNCLIHPPSAFQGFDRLISLKLYHVTVSSAFQGFYRLISLELCDVGISSELLGSLISHCPLLEQLVFHSVMPSDIIEINAPMLRSFDFSGDISSLWLKYVPLLAKVSLAAVNIYAENLDFAMLFESCSSLEHLILDLYSAQFSEDEAPARLPFDLNSGKHFCLPKLMMHRDYRLSCALCLIKSFPSLECLEIQVDNDESDYDESDGYEDLLELEHFSDTTFNHLREVKLDFSSGTPEMQLIELFLAKSPVLERMVIGPWLYNESLDSRIEVLAELSKFSRASPEAVIETDTFWTLKQIR